MDYLSLFYISLLVIFAAFSSGIQDTIDFLYTKSVFINIKNEFWYKWWRSWHKDKFIDGDESKGRRKLFGKIPIPTQIIDAWHTFKLFKITALVSASVFFSLGITSFLLGFIVLLYFSIIWFFVFQFTFHRLFLKPEFKESIWGWVGDIFE